MKRRYLFALGALLALSSVFVILLRAGHPHHREIAMILYAAGFLLCAGSMIQNRTHHFSGLIGRYGRSIAAVLFLVVVGVTLYAIFPGQEREFAKMDTVVLDELLEQDRADAARLIASVDGAWTSPDIAGLSGKDYAALSPADRELILSRWSWYVDHAVALDGLTQRHRHFYQINYLDQPALNLRSFLIAYSAFLANQRNALQLRAFVDRSAGLAGILNDERPGMVAGNYARIVQGLTHPQSLLLMNAGRANLKFLNRAGVALPEEDLALARYSESAYTDIFRALGKEPEIFLDNPLSIYEANTFRIWFPLQKEISEAMGDLRTTKRANLISETQAASVRHRLEPGDIIVERRNWYLSNVGLPGFWPHAALYTGRLEDLDAFFAGEPALEGLSFSEMLREKYPELHAEYTATTHGFPPSVLEAVSEGVTLHPWEESAAADYVCVMRPRLSKTERLDAILRAFSFHLRPYDFNFDFVSDNALVCSEVVYKAYEPRAGNRGLRFDLETTAGRLVVAPNNMIAKFDREYDSPKRELDFVLFLDGIEKEHLAVERSPEDLRSSWRRPKWDVLQK